MSNNLQPPLGSFRERPDAAANEKPAPLGGMPLAQKFDLGDKQGATPQYIPWGYDQDRVTAMAVDPEGLFVYWEVTDAAIERARAGLGPGGPSAWLNLRVYDVTDRIFDGTNAHSYFDHKLERGDRQWFFHIGKPTSTTTVELGMKSLEGHFVKIARSSRIDFPRREPAPWQEPEWLTVHSANGPVGSPFRAGAAEHEAGGAEEPPYATAGDEGGLYFEHERGHHELVHRIIAQMIEHRWDWERVFSYEWASALTSLQWEGPIIRTSWEAGPFTFPVEVPGLTEQRFEGRSVVYSQHGTTHIIYGPWQVVIRGIGAHAERKVLGLWEIYRSWVSSAGMTIRNETWRATMPGGSEVVMGASERRFVGASEVRLRGGSELFQVGASELRLAGASETLFAGASEWRLRGASELAYAGASEWRARGASERMMAGASEWRAAGASELRLGGASERVALGASERLGAAEPRLETPEGHLGYPEVPLPRGDERSAGGRHG
jgi:hypothetical protein